MGPFSPGMFPNRITFLPATWTTGPRAGPKPAYPPDGVVVMAYVETSKEGNEPIEAEGSRVTVQARYSVFVGFDPSGVLGRPLVTDDRILWVDEGLILLVRKHPPKHQGPLWLIECQHTA